MKLSKKQMIRLLSKHKIPFFVSSAKLDNINVLLTAAKKKINQMWEKRSLT